MIYCRQLIEMMERRLPSIGSKSRWKIVPIPFEPEIKKYSEVMFCTDMLMTAGGAKRFYRETARIIKSICLKFNTKVAAVMTDDELRSRRYGVINNFRKNKFIVLFQ